MTTRVESDEIRTTASEKVLTVVLAVFISIGAIWGYDKLGEVHQPAPDSSYGQEAQTNPVFAELNRASAEQRAADRELRQARQDLSLAGDAAYEDAKTRFEAAEGRADEANAALAAARAPADEIRSSSAEEFRDRERTHNRIVFGLRLLYVGLLLGGSYLLLGRMRRRRSRYLVASFALIGASTLVALVMATDYTTDYIDVGEIGPLALSLAGIALTLGAFVALQRYMAKRLPLRRVRRLECPFCGYNVRDNSHCEGCGRRVIGKCSSCQKPRRVGTQHCGACGEAR